MEFSVAPLPCRAARRIGHQAHGFKISDGLQIAPRKAGTIGAAQGAHSSVIDGHTNFRLIL